MPQTPNSHNLQTIAGKSGGQPLKTKPLELNPTIPSDDSNSRVVIAKPNPNTVDHVKQTRFPEYQAHAENDVDIIYSNDEGGMSNVESSIGAKTNLSEITLPGTTSREVSQNTSGSGEKGQTSAELSEALKHAKEKKDVKHWIK